MQRYVVTAMTAIALGGCGQQGTPSAGQSFQSSVLDKEKQVTASIASDDAEQRRAIRFYSNGSYACGDGDSDSFAQSRTPYVTKAKIANNPTHAVQSSDATRSGQTTAALAYLATYQRTLAQMIAAGQQKAKADDAVFTEAKSVTSAIGSTNIITSAAASLLGAAIDGLQQAAAANDQALLAEALRKYASQVEPALEQSVGVLETNYEAFLSPGEGAFTQWDSCARETVYYLRDVASPDGILLATGKKLPAYFPQPTLTEVQAAWLAYRNKRAGFKNSLPTQQQFNAALDAIVKNNQALAAPTKVTFETVSTLASNVGSSINTVYQDFEKAKKS